MITRQDVKYVRKAIEVSRTSDYPRVHIGCIIVHKHNILASGCNKCKTHPVQYHYNELRPYSVNIPCMHAETAAALQLKCKVKHSTAYVGRIGKDARYKLARPCQACLKLLRRKGVNRIVYTTNEGIEEMFSE